VAKRAWNHNTFYHPLLLRQVPTHAKDALDIGCGDGIFACKLLQRGLRVTAVDVDEGEVAKSRLIAPGASIICGDFMELALEPATFDFVGSLAVFHHLPFADALKMASELLRERGTLAILGVWVDTSTQSDAVWNCASSTINRLCRHVWGPDVMSSPQKMPLVTLDQTRALVRAILPHAKVRRLPLWRYLITWTRDAGNLRC